MNPPARIPAALLKKLRAVRLLALDVDGVLTDGTFTLDKNGCESKSFCARDGQGLKLLRDFAGVPASVISGRKTTATVHRARELGIDHVHVGVKDKPAVLRAVVRRLGLQLDQVCYVGDDVEDIPVLELSGLGVLVSDAPIRGLYKPDFFTHLPGGRGAVREVCDLILHARGLHAKVLKHYLEKTA